MISECIRPLPHIHVGPGTAGKAVFTFINNDITIYPKLPSGQSCRVVIKRRNVISSNGAIISVCRNAGKWSYKITYAFSNKPTKLNHKQFVTEVTRLGAAHMIDNMFE